MDYYEHERKAANLLSHYMSQVYKAAGLRWDSDNSQEMSEVVDEIILAAFDRMMEREDGQNS